MYNEFTILFCEYIGSKDEVALLSKCNFVMIKYPRKGRSIPHERIFKMDFENLVQYACWTFV